MTSVEHKAIGDFFMSEKLKKAEKFKKFYDVAVFFGGASSESEVSVITGTMVCNVLIKGGKSVLPVFIDKKGNTFTGEKLTDITVFKDESYAKFPACGLAGRGVVIMGKGGVPKSVSAVGCVINCCHGGVCEGGALAGACALFNIPFASAGLFESAVFMDKYFTKLILKGLGITTAKYAYSRDISGATEGANSIGYPVIVKPATLGSSIGIAKCADESQLKAALETAFELDDGVLIEEYLSPRREINCAAYYSDGRTVISPLEEAVTEGELLSYDDKYCGGGKRVFPAELDKKTEDKISQTTERVYSALNMRGLVRFDYIVSGGKVYLSEINTVPGSLSQYLVSDSYNGFYGVLCGIMEQARADFFGAKSKTVLSTGILNDIKPSTKLK